MSNNRFTSQTHKKKYKKIGSVAPQLLTCYFIAENGMPEISAEGHNGSYIRKWVVMSIMFLWATRLTFNWARSWSGFDHEDWRYVEVFEKDTKNKIQYWIESFAGIHVFPTLIVYFALIPAYYILHDDDGYIANDTLNIYDFIGFLVGFGAVLLQGVADNQLYHFRNTNTIKGKCLTTGAWSWCRHPNYGGEILHWTSYVILSCGAFGFANGIKLAGGCVSIICLFVFASVPMIEKRHGERRNQKEWKAYQKRTWSSLIPMPF